MNHKRKYLLLIVAILAIITFNQTLIQYFLHSQKEDTSVINMAGRQRMLSQRVNQLSYRCLTTSNKEDHFELTHVLNTWKNAHLELMNGVNESGYSETNELEIYQKLSHTLSIINEIDSILSIHKTITKKNIAEINERTDNFLPLMEIIVADFEKTANQKLSNIILLEILLALITILVIFVEFYLVIKPSYVKTLKQNKLLKNIAWQQSHEMRRPLANILGLVKMLQENKKLKPEELEKVLSYIYQSSEELDEIVHKIVIQTNQNNSKEKNNRNS